MTILPLLLTLNTILLFISMVGAYYLESSWAIFLYPLGFSIGTYFWAIYLGISQKFFCKKQPWLALIITASGVGLFYLLLYLLPPILPPPPDPFVKKPPHPLDWHTIAVLTLPQSFFLYGFWKGTGFLTKFWQSSTESNAKGLAAVLTLLLGVHGINQLFPKDSFVMLLIIDFFAVFAALVFRYKIKTPEKQQ